MALGPSFTQLYIKTTSPINFNIINGKSAIPHSNSLYFFFLLFLLFNVTILYWFCHISTGIHVFSILNPPPSSLPVPSFWVIPVHQPQASCILHRTWTGDSFLIWYYTCFNAILPNHPPLPLPQSPKDCSIHQCLFCCLVYRVIVTIFLNSIYMR